MKLPFWKSFFCYLQHNRFKSNSYKRYYPCSIFSLTIFPVAMQYTLRVGAIPWMLVVEIERIIIHMWNALSEMVFFCYLQHNRFKSNGHKRYNPVPSFPVATQYTLRVGAIPIRKNKTNYHPYVKRPFWKRFFSVIYNIIDSNLMETNATTLFHLSQLQSNTHYE